MTKKPDLQNLLELFRLQHSALTIADQAKEAASKNLSHIQFLENLGTSNYHSLQTRLEKRFSQGLAGLISYTWGKALTNSVDHLSTSGAGNGVDVGVFREPQNPLNR